MQPQKLWKRILIMRNQYRADGLTSLSEMGRFVQGLIWRELRALLLEVDSAGFAHPLAGPGSFGFIAPNQFLHA